MKIALISCTSNKQEYKCSAGEMYQVSKTFSLSYDLATLCTDKIYILSAKHHLLDPNTLIEPYNLALATFDTAQRRNWAKEVVTQLKEKCDLEQDEFIILAGKDYYQYLLPALNRHIIPLGHVTQGVRPEALRRLILKLQSERFDISLSDGYMVELEPPGKSEDFNYYNEIHNLFNNMQQFKASEIDNIPFDNGIYIIFETGETYKHLKRIVRVGTHDSEARLRDRLKDHFLRKNKDGSVFRKNVGKAILNKRENPYLVVWSMDTSKRENKKFIDAGFQDSIEEEVSDYLESNMSFVVLPVEGKERRLRLEKAIIASLNQFSESRLSDNWLGNNSPEEQIRSSGLWLKIGLDADPLNTDEMEFIRQVIGTEPKVISAKPEQFLSQIRNPSRGINTASSDLRKRNRDPGVAEIRDFILGKFAEVRSTGGESCVVISGHVHREMDIQVNRMPSVCSAMKKLVRPGDQVLHTTPSGKSSTLEIKYFLN